VPACTVLVVKAVNRCVWPSRGAESFATSSREHGVSPVPPVPPSHLNGPPDPERRFRLMEIVRRVLRERRYSARTVMAYVSWFRRFILANARRHPTELGAEEVRAFLSDLAVRERVSASTQNQGLAARSLH
jgi:hypothetical protein